MKLIRALDAQNCTLKEIISVCDHFRYAVSLQASSGIKNTVKRW